MHGNQCSPLRTEALINIVSKTILCLDVRILELMVNIESVECTDSLDADKVLDKAKGVSTTDITVLSWCTGTQGNNHCLFIVCSLC